MTRTLLGVVTVQYAATVHDDVIKAESKRLGFRLLSRMRVYNLGVFSMISCSGAGCG